MKILKMLNSKFVLFTFLFVFATDANAYLDPGSGNALICLVLSLFGAFIYYLKSIFYKLVSILTGKKVKVDKDEQIAIFSEGKNYWLTYKPIVEELIAQKVPFIYYSMDIHDPALTIDNSYMNSKYIGSSNNAYAKVGSLKTKILLTTTPNIGCPNYPIRRPSKVQKMCHVWHSISDSTVYHIGALDHFDVALTVGDWVESSLRHIEKIRKLNKKEIVAVGLPCFDELKSRLDKKISEKSNNFDEEKNTSHSKSKVILVAPSWGTKCCLKVYGTSFIKQALDQGFKVIFRPHPHSVKIENDYVQNVYNQFKDYENFSFDTNTDATDSLIKSDMMISDKSGVRFDYAFLYEKPVLTLDVPVDVCDDYEAALVGRMWGELEADLIGIRLQPNEKDKIMDSIKETLKFDGSELIKLRDSLLKNFGSSATHIVNWMKDECANNNN